MNGLLVQVNEHRSLRGIDFLVTLISPAFRRHHKSNGPTTRRHPNQTTMPLGKPRQRSSSATAKGLLTWGDLSGAMSSATGRILLSHPLLVSFAERSLESVLESGADPLPTPRRGTASTGQENDTSLGVQHVHPAVTRFPP